MVPVLISPNHIFLIIFITFSYDKVGGAYIYRLKISKKEDTFRDPHSIDQKKEEDHPSINSIRIAD